MVDSLKYTSNKRLKLILDGALIIENDTDIIELIRSNAFEYLFDALKKSKDNINFLTLHIGSTEVLNEDEFTPIKNIIFSFCIDGSCPKGIQLHLPNCFINSAGSLFNLLKNQYQLFDITIPQISKDLNKIIKFICNRNRLIYENRSDEEVTNLIIYLTTKELQKVVNSQFTALKKIKINPPSLFTNTLSFIFQNNQTINKEEVPENIYEAYVKVQEIKPNLDTCLALIQIEDDGISDYGDSSEGEKTEESEIDDNNDTSDDEISSPTIKSKYPRF